MVRELLFRISSYLYYRFTAVNAHGLHSPFVFDFYNEVISPKKEFYFFKRFRPLLTKYKNSISTENALFLYRWSVFYKPQSVYLKKANLPVALALSTPSISKDLNVYALNDYSEKELNVLSSLGVLVQEGANADMCFFEQLDTQSLRNIQQYSCVVVFKPHKSKAKEGLWDEFCNSTHVSISIDLYQFGILLIDKNQAKQHFVVKFS